MDSVRFGIIGCGGIARRAFLPAVAALDEVHVMAVASQNIEKARRCASETGCEAEETYDSLLNRSDLDAVYIATPTGMHTEWAVKAAQRGLHVLCEKSLAPSLAEVELIIQAGEKNNVSVLEGFAYQFHSQHSFVRNMVQEGQIGQPVVMQAWFGFPPLDPQNFRYDKNLGGGALLDAGAYTVHIARRFYGREPVQVFSTLDVSSSGVDIHGSVLLDFGLGQTAHLAFGFDNMYKNSYQIWGTEGTLSLSRAFSIPPKLPPVLVLERQDFKEEITLPPSDQFVAEINHFCKGISDTETRIMWVTDARNQARVMRAIQDCAQTTYK